MGTDRCYGGVEVVSVVHGLLVRLHEKFGEGAQEVRCDKGEKMRRTSCSGKCKPRRNPRNTVAAVESPASKCSLMEARTRTGREGKGGRGLGIFREEGGGEFPGLGRVGKVEVVGSVSGRGCRVQGGWRWKMTSGAHSSVSGEQERPGRAGCAQVGPMRNSRAGWRGWAGSGWAG